MQSNVNVACAIYRAGRTPPALPDVADVPGLLQPVGFLAGSTRECTHSLLVDAAVDVRDDYDQGMLGSSADLVVVGETRFTVLFVERMQRGQTNDHRRVYLQRHLPTWPTMEL